MNNPLLDHWQAIYRDKDEAQTSWFRAHLDESLRLIDALHVPKTAPVIDVGAGRSTLADDLIARGFADVTVLDIAESALTAARARLGANSLRVHWLAADVIATTLPAVHFGLWHDRAVFHFLLDEETRRRYVEQAAHALRPGGHAIVATFAADGPDSCSALPVQRYEAPALASQFAPYFEFVRSAREEHVTPWGTTQPFTYVVLRRTHSASQ